MLGRLLAPAQFTFLNMRKISQLFPVINKGTKTVPARKAGLAPRALIVNRVAKPLQRDAYIPSQEISRKLNIFQGISAKSFVQNLLSHEKTAVTGDNQVRGKKLSLNLSVRYKVNSKFRRPHSESGSNRAASSVVKRDAVNRYRSTRTVSAAIKDRDTQVRLFYNQTEQAVSRIQTEHVEDYRGVRDKVAGVFQYDLSIDFSFLQQFHNQSVLLNEKGDKELAGYLQNTDKLIDRSPKLTKAFFDAVDEILIEARKNFIARISQFFEDLRIAFGDKAEFLERDKESIVNQASTFFDNVNKLLDNAEADALNTLEKPEITEQPTGAVKEAPVKGEKVPEEPIVESQPPNPGSHIPENE